MSSGEDIIATVLSEVDDAISISNVLVAIPTQNGQIGFAPWSPIMDPNEESVEVF